MINDTKYASSMINDSKTKITYLANQLLDFIMTENNDYIVIDKSGYMINEVKY